MIRDSLKAASDRQKSYTYLKRKDIEFKVGDKVIFVEENTSIWSEKQESPRVIGPYEIVERVGPVSYKLILPPELEMIHNVFHVSMLRQYRSDPSHVIAPTEVEVQSDLSYSEEPIRILAREAIELQNKRISLVKVLWNKHGVEEAMWEPEDAMREQYPHLFIGKIFRDENP
ncbi:DNA/RNA polymerase superfamily protein [Gossypium australe]|uniref:DNA/RNA polymerase superfamily protein n=1 Tax=Gossypium australe TaxID=47621 RepID=A0A5B6WRQ6_9ROSI|nr:DNA/RNA polymerase superfamily protein [Gossypium australe]